MKKKMLFASIFLIFNSLAPSYAVENGFEVRDEPNAVSINSSGGFLYAPRIVLTTAHNHLEDDGKTLLVSLPGEPWAPNSKKVVARKVFLPSTYKDRTYISGGNVFSRTDDFAVVVLEQPIPLKNVVKIATKEQIEQFKSTHMKAKLVGYGLQSADMRANTNDGRDVTNVVPKLINSSFLNDVEAQSIIRSSLPPGAIFNYDANIKLSPETGSICDNDSGSGWFVEQGGVRYYIGAASGGWGFPNCRKEGFWGNAGAMASVSAAYKFMDLINEAETYIKNQKVQCAKGIKIKEFKLQKCPTGYKFIRFRD